LVLDSFPAEIDRETVTLRPSKSTSRQRAQLTQTQSGGRGDDEERGVLLVAAAAIARISGVEGFHRSHTLLGPLGGSGDRVVGEAEALLAAGELEDRVEDLAVDVHRPRREVLAVELGEEHADVLRGDPEEVIPPKARMMRAPRCLRSPLGSRRRSS
jgi:hypothetical protein